MATWLLALLVAAGAVRAAPDAESVAWDKKSQGFAVRSGQSLSLDVDGPGALLLELRGATAETISLELLRDEKYRSSNRVTLKKASGPGPQGMPFGAKLGIAVPAGTHRVVVSTDAKGLAMLPTLGKQVQKTFASAAEVEVSGAQTPTSASADPAWVAPIPADGNATAISGSLVPATSPRLQQALRIAVYDFELNDIDPKVGSVVTDSVLSEIRKLQGVSAIGAAEIRDMLSHEANKQLIGCEENESCLAEIAGALGVDNLITGSLSNAAGSHVFLLRRADQKRANIVGTVNKRLEAGSGQEFLLAIGPSVEELFPDRALREGVERGVAREVALRLDPPPLPRWSVYAVAGGAAGAGIVSLIFKVLANESEKQYKDKANDSLTQTVEGSELMGYGNTAKSRLAIATYSGITAGALLLSAGVMAFFTDWHGYGEQR